MRYIVSPIHLHLVAHIGVPLDTTDIVLDLLVDRPRDEVAVDWEKFGIPLYLAAHLVDVQRAKMGAEFPLSVLADFCKILVLEYEHPALGRQQRQFIALLAGQRAQLQAADLGPDSRRDLLEARSRGTEEGLLFWIGSEPDIYMLELLERWLLSGHIVRQV